MGAAGVLGLCFLLLLLPGLFADFLACNALAYGLGVAVLLQAQLVDVVYAMFLGVADFDHVFACLGAAEAVLAAVGASCYLAFVGVLEGVGLWVDLLYLCLATEA